MNSRFKFRLPFYNNNGEFSHFEFILIGESLPAYNAGVMFHRGEYEQCTGLKDKNGNLIYESDYIKDKWNNTTYLIKWVDAKFMCIDTEEMMPDTSPRQDWLDKCGFEIIGNIHEQAEQKDVK